MLKASPKSDHSKKQPYIIYPLLFSLSLAKCTIAVYAAVQWYRIDDDGDTLYILWTQSKIVTVFLLLALFIFMCVRHLQKLGTWSVAHFTCALKNLLNICSFILCLLLCLSLRHFRLADQWGVVSVGCPWKVLIRSKCGCCTACQAFKASVVALIIVVIFAFCIAFFWCIHIQD